MGWGQKRCLFLQALRRDVQNILLIFHLSYLADRGCVLYTWGRRGERSAREGCAPSVMTQRLSTRSHYRRIAYLYYILQFFYINPFCFYQLIDYVAKREERWRVTVFTNNLTTHTWKKKTVFLAYSCLCLYLHEKKPLWRWCLHTSILCLVEKLKSPKDPLAYYFFSSF